jgi:hypothetical protein
MCFDSVFRFTSVNRVSSNEKVVPTEVKELPPMPVLLITVIFMWCRILIQVENHLGFTPGYIIFVRGSLGRRAHLHW